ncbi:Hypothetical predicted protein [Mytilus galloprovincialis]|uniref:Paired domain-containing protein n=1 Tax=Mytilus galloprovincialis TaxID=29158 RepID=A0A8B6GIJ7_MYTGA|nr:Hypothetical predicted protein [Mytilus galloprovincialis]
MMISQSNRFYKKGIKLDETDQFQIHHLKESGKRISEIARKTGVSVPTVKKYFYKDEPIKRPREYSRPIMTNDVIECIAFFVENRPSIQIREIQNKLLDTGVCTLETCPTESSICRALRNDLLLTRKKIRPVAKESQTLNVETSFDDYINLISTTNSFNLHFFDESSFLKNTCNRKYGYSLYGHEAIEIQRFASDATLTLNLLHSRTGIDYFNLVEGASNSLHLLNFFSDVFNHGLYGAPILSPGDIVIMDNCRFHHARLIQNNLEYLFANNGVTLIYQPPYHPELNTCEYCFKLIKDGIKRENNFYEYHMELAIADSVLNSVNQSLSERIFQHCGYIR